MGFFKKTVGLKSLVYDSSLEALRKLIDSDLGLEVVKISPRGYKMSNGIDYCSITLRSRDGGHFSLQAYGEEAIKLYERASMMVLTPTILVST